MLFEAPLSRALTMGSRATKKVGRRALLEYPYRKFCSLVGHPNGPSDLEVLLKKADIFARMVSSTYDFADPELRGTKAPWSLDFILRKFQYSRMPAKEFDSPHRELLADDRCPVIVFWNQAIEKVVVSVRGTLRTSLSDIKEDYRILTKKLHESDRTVKIEQLVRHLIDRFGHESVIVTGHSLGAAITFLIARKLYLEGKEVEGHFFALPFMPIEKFLWEIAKLLIKPLSMLNMFQNVLGLNGVVEGCLQKMIQLVSDSEVDLQELVGWHPHVYVQEYDDIANGNIEHFNKTSLSAHGQEMYATTMLVQGLHLCPSAILITGKAGVETLSSHGIGRWIDVEPLRFKCVKFTNFHAVKEYERKRL